MVLKPSSLAVIFVFLSSLSGAAQTVHVTGTVSDSMGAVISKAHVRVRLNTFTSGAAKNQRRPSEVALGTDKNGRFETDLVPGFYDVCVHSPAFSAKCKTVVVRPNHAPDLRMTLKVDPDIVAEFGDDFGIDYGIKTIPSEAPEQELKD
jgi:hypothetical protein